MECDTPAPRRAPQGPRIGWPTSVSMRARRDGGSRQTMTKDEADEARCTDGQEDDNRGRQSPQKPAPPPLRTNLW